MTTKKWSDMRPGFTEEQEAEITRSREALRSEEIIYSLSELRKACGVTQTELAEELELTQPRISTLEKNNDPKLSTLKAIAKALSNQTTQDNVSLRIQIGEKEFLLT